MWNASKQNERVLIPLIPIPNVATYPCRSIYFHGHILLFGQWPHDSTWSNQNLSVYPLPKSINSEKVVKLIVKHWNSIYGKPTSIISDKDVRLTQDQCFYNNGFYAMYIRTILTTPPRAAIRRSLRKSKTAPSFKIWESSFTNKQWFSLTIRYH